MVTFSTQLQGQSPPAPVRSTKKAVADEECDEGEEQEDDGGAQDILDLLPRTDVGQLNTHAEIF